MKYALLTGASGGIGNAVAETLAERGYGLYLHYHRNQRNIDALMERLKRFDLPVRAIQADFSEKEAVHRVLADIHHDIDTIIHNSGTTFYGLVTDMKDEKVYEMVQSQITTPFLLTKYLLPSMIRRKSGNILVISSIWGIVGASCEVLYSTVKGGLNTFVKALAKEVAPSGIRVNGIAPGAVLTNMISSFNEEELKALEEEIPMGRFGKPSEIADLVDFLLSERSAYINGQIISINGAWH